MGGWDHRGWGGASPSPITVGTGDAVGASAPAAEAWPLVGVGGKYTLPNPLVFIFLGMPTLLWHLPPTPTLPTIT